MGRLIDISEFAIKPFDSGLRPDWYFPDAICVRDDNWRFTVASGFPHALYVHGEALDARLGFMVQVRVWVERTLDFSVIVNYVNKNYRYRLPRDGSTYTWYDTTEVIHGYYGFHFENSSDQVMCMLQFGDVFAAKMLDRHPGYGWIKERFIVY